jgi:leukotriene-A4 hydrolase
MVRYAAPLFLIVMTSCSNPEKEVARDIHSYGNPELARVRHLSLDLEVLFNQLTIRGAAVLTIDRMSGRAGQLVLDTRALQIDEAEISPDGVQYREARFDVGKTDPILGAPLHIDIAPDTRFVRVRYSTSPSSATALQWLKPEQTEGKRHPFLYTQSQAIHARSWIPLQDSPGVRVTWEARVKVPEGLKAVMSAVNCPDRFSRGRSALSFNRPPHRRVGRAGASR